MALVLVASAV